MLLAQIDDDLCQVFPEIRESTVDELGTIAGEGIWLLNTIRMGKNLIGVIEAKALHDAWLEAWVPYQQLPGTLMTNAVVPAEIQDRICGLIIKTRELAERLYVEDKSGAIAVSYGDFLRAIGKVKDRVTPWPKQPGKTSGALFLVGAVLLAGALGVGVAHWRSRPRKVAVA